MTPLLVTAAEIREPQYLGVSERGLRDLLKRGLPYIKVGKRKMFPPKEVEQWVSDQAGRPTGSTSAPGRPSGTIRSPSKVIGFDEALARIERMSRTSRRPTSTARR